MTHQPNNVSAAGVLLPCPFCGSSKVGMASEHDSDTGGVFLSIKCSGCRASSGAGFSTEPCPQTYQEVRDEWNRRAAASAQPSTKDRWTAREEAAEAWEARIIADGRNVSCREAACFEDGYEAAASAQATVQADLLPNALWTRNGSGSFEWWSFKGYEARKDTADQWVLRKSGEELYRHTHLQVVMARAERELLAAAPSPAAREAGDGATLTDDKLKALIRKVEDELGIVWFVPDDSERYLWRTITTNERDKFVRALLREAGSR